MVTTRYSDQQGSKSRQKVMRLYKQWHRPISKRFIKPPYSIREQPRSTRNVVAYPRPAFSAKNRKNYAPTSFDQQVQVSQGHCVLSSHLFWTSDLWTYQPGSRDQGRSHRISPPSFCGTCHDFLTREEFDRPFPSSTVESTFVYPRNNHSPLAGHDVRKNSSSCDCTEIRTHVPRSEAFEVPTEQPGRPVK